MGIEVELTDARAAKDWKRVARLKADGLLEKLASREGQTFTWGEFQITLVRALVQDEGDNRYLTLYLVILKNDIPVPINNPVMILNPPVGTGSDADLETWANNLLADLTNGY